MSIENTPHSSLPGPSATGRPTLDPRRQAPQDAAVGFDPGLAEEPAAIEFTLEPANTRISNEQTRSRRTSWDASGEVTVAAPGVGAVQANIVYSADLPASAATPEAMRALNPFDPETLPRNARVSLNGADYVSTPFEASFRALAAANDIDIDDLRLVLFHSKQGQLRVMSGPASIFDAPKAHGPGSLPAAREDFDQHTTLLQDPAQAEQRAALNAMFLTGKLPDATTVIREEADGKQVDATIADVGSGEVNTVRWQLDGQGRPVHAEATLTWEPSSAGRDSDSTETKAQADFRKDNGLRGSGDDVGHIFAYRFVTGHGAVNMFPQDSHLNQRVYAKLEQEWSDWLAMGMEVKIVTTLSPQEVTRPEQMQVDYEVIDPDSGKVVYDPSVIVFANRSGQQFDPIARNQMDDIIGRAAA